MDKRLAAVVTLVLLLSLVPACIPVKAQTTSGAEEKALAFIENVIQPDVSLYNITLVSDIVGLQESVTYHLAETSTGLGPDIICLFENGSLIMVELSEESPSLVYSNPSTNLTEQTVGLLERYQAYVGLNLQDMINALANVDVTQNLTKTVGDITLTADSSSLETDVSLKYTYNGAVYTGVSFTFRSGQFYSFSEDYSRWTIGNTDVNVNENQAINIAKQYMQTYSYTLDNGAVVNQFNITTITAGLNTYPRGNTTTIYPYWSVQVNLDDTFPVDCYAISIGIWADSGTVIFAQPLFVGGGAPSPSTATPTDTATPTQSPTQTMSIPEYPYSAVGTIILAWSLLSALSFAVIIRHGKRNRD